MPRGRLRWPRKLVYAWLKQRAPGGKQLGRRARRPISKGASVDQGDKFLADLMDDLKHNRLKLPTLPEVAVKVRKVVEDGGASAAQIAKTVGIDVALAARLVQVANSPLFRGTAQVENVQAAVARLGNDQVRNLVTSLIMQQLFQSKSPLLKLRMQALWMHSTEVAAISQVLARNYTRISPDEAMLAGLVHDIGALPILTRAEANPAIAGAPEALDAIVEKVHASLGRLILESWKFPASMATVAARHEDLTYQSADGPDLVDVVLVANLHSRIGTQHRHGKINWATVPSFARLGLTPEQSIKAMDEARQDIAAVQKMLAA